MVATMVSCGNKTAKGGDNDSTAIADSIVTEVSAESAELWTEEAVEALIRLYHGLITGDTARSCHGFVPPYLYGISSRTFFCSSSAM